MSTERIDGSERERRRLRASPIPFLEVSVWEPSGEKHWMQCAKPDVRAANQDAQNECRVCMTAYSELGWYREQHRPLFYSRRRCFFIFLPKAPSTSRLFAEAPPTIRNERSIAMKDKINGILSEAQAKISAAASEGELQNVKSAYLGKQGELSLLMKELPGLPAEERAGDGQAFEPGQSPGDGADQRKAHGAEVKRPRRSPQTLTVPFPGLCPSGEASIPSPRCAMT